MIIAIDGYSSTGKSTLAKDLASALNISYVDTGAMYRAVTLQIIRDHIALEDEEAIQEMLDRIEITFQNIDGKNTTFLNDENVEDLIRDRTVSSLVSPVATISVVRDQLVSLQRKMAEKVDGLVMDGRDIGTVVFPDAQFKFFITSSVDTRTMRRYNEMLQKGKKVTIEQVKQNLMDRDRIDSTRAHSPLKKADDAIEIDNTLLTKKEQLELLLSYIKGENYWY